MKAGIGRMYVAGLAWLLFAGGAFAQTEEIRERWPHYREIYVPGPGAGLLDVVLDVPVLSHAKDDFADLRLYDAAGREIPYDLRVRQEVYTSDAFDAREFNRGASGRTAEVSLDLGEQPQEHNEMDVETGGENFRRLVEVHGSNDGSSWLTLVSAARIFHFSGARGSVHERLVRYPVSRYRYVRVRVHADPETDGGAPAIQNVTVRRAVREEAEVLEFPASFSGREATREGGRAASAHRFSLGGSIPLHGLDLVAGEGAFSRPYRLTAVGGDRAFPLPLSSGQLSRAGEDSSPVRLTFPEQRASEVELTVTDDRNPELLFFGATALSYARQVIFDADAAGTGIVRLYYGNPKAEAPHYDFARALPRELPALPQRLVLGPELDNPDYEPEPAPLSERSPWLIYAVLGAASVALFVLLRNLTKALGTADTEP